MAIKNIYTLHRRLSLIIALPIVLSAGSGIMHPLMTNIRPHIATQGLTPLALDSAQLVFTPKAALQSAGIDSFCHLRLVRIDTNWFYQVTRYALGVPIYISTRKGRVLPKGDWLYAQYLARAFLEGPPGGTAGPPGGAAGPPGGASGPSGKAAGPSARAAGTSGRTEGPSMNSALPDCCSQATSVVLGARGAPVKSVTRLTRYDEEYNEINRLLPVYKVCFDRADSIRIYVETAQDKFAFAVDERRARFNALFADIHTYRWLDFLGAGRMVVEFLLVFIAFVTTVLGIYIFFKTRSRKVAGNAYVRKRRNHRYVAIVVSVFTLMFTFSGGYHALSKLKDDTRDQYFVWERTAARDLKDGLTDVFSGATGTSVPGVESKAGGCVTGLDLVRLNGQLYWQVSMGVRASGPTPLGKSIVSGDAPKDLMKSMSAIPTALHYIDEEYGSELVQGDRKYALYLASLFSGHRPADTLSIRYITKFDNEYNFTDKRLPVYRVAYRDNNRERYYVETSSGRLSVRVDNLDLTEAYVFAFMHKHEFLSWAGKSVKDASTMFWAATQVLMVLLGLILYLAYRKRQLS